MSGARASQERAGCVFGKDRQHSMDGDQLCRGVNARLASLEVLLGARGDAVRIRGCCHLVKHGILEVRGLALSAAASCASPSIRTLVSKTPTHRYVSAKWRRGGATSLGAPRVPVFPKSQNRFVPTATESPLSHGGHIDVCVHPPPTARGGNAGLGFACPTAAGPA